MKKGSVEFAVGIFVIIGIICIGYLTIKLGQMKWLGDNYYPIEARFMDISGLKKGSQVELAGVKIGMVDDIRLDQERMMAIVTLKIEKDLKLSEDSIASIKTSGIIGDKYVKISPGGSPDMLEPGDMIIETESALDLEEMVSKYVFGDV